LIPRSNAISRTRNDSFSSAVHQNCIVPMHNAETFIPDRPSRRYSIFFNSILLPLYSWCMRDSSQDGINPKPALMRIIGIPRCSGYDLPCPGLLSARTSESYLINVWPVKTWIRLIRFGFWIIKKCSSIWKIIMKRSIPCTSNSASTRMYASPRWLAKGKSERWCLQARITSRPKR